jgi:hypothetical protein
MKTAALTPPSCFITKRMWPREEIAEIRLNAVTGARGFNNGRFTFFRPGAARVMIGAHLGGVAEIDLSTLFLRYLIDFRIHW